MEQKMQLTTIKQNDGIFIQIPKHIMKDMDKIVSSFDDNTHQIHIAFYPKQETNISPEVQQLSGSLNAYIGTDADVIADDEKAFLQSLLDDDNRIKAGQ